MIGNILLLSSFVFFNKQKQEVMERLFKTFTKTSLLRMPLLDFILLHFILYNMQNTYTPSH